jgi:undecaprenyl-diphosphatase
MGERPVGQRPVGERPVRERPVGERAHGLDRALVRITRAANYSRLWLLIAAGLAACGGREGRRAAGRGIVALAIAAAVANGPAKLLVRRRRPLSDSPTLIPLPRSSSFPSGHSATAFAFATGTCVELPVLVPVLVPLAIAVAYSRIHTGVHYPSDVAAGAAIGIGSGVIAPRLARRVGLREPGRFGRVDVDP